MGGGSFLSVSVVKKDNVMEEKAKKRRDRWLHLRLTEDEYMQLQERFLRTTERKLSRYARKVFLSKPINVLHRDASLDELIAVLVKVQNDLNGVTNNYNQMVHKLHVSNSYRELKQWVDMYEKEKIQLFSAIEKVKDIITEGAQLWLR